MEKNYLTKCSWIYLFSDDLAFCVWKWLLFVHRGISSMDKYKSLILLTENIIKYRNNDFVGHEKSLKRRQKMKVTSINENTQITKNNTYFYVVIFWRNFLNLPSNNISSRSFFSPDPTGKTCKKQCFLSSLRRRSLVSRKVGARSSAHAHTRYDK